MKAQVSIMYLVITIAIAFVLASGVFLFAKSFGSALGGDVAEIGLERVAQQLENAFLDLKYIADSTNASSANITIKIPKEIGRQRYAISGDGSNRLELRTQGDRSVVKLLELDFWNVSLNGLADSSQGAVTLELNQSLVSIK